MRRRAAILHPSLEVLGGCEFLAFSLARALSEYGYTVEILTASTFNPGELREKFNIDPGAFIIRVVRSRKLVFLARAVFGKRLARARLVTYTRTLLNNVDRSKYDLIIDTQSNLPTNVDISYIHFPLILQKPASAGSLGKVYDYLIGREVGKIIGRPRLILTNSQWTAGKVWDAYRMKAEVLHPPVDVEYFAGVADVPRTGKIAVTVTRLEPTKNIHELVRVAAKLPEYLFIFVGTRGRNTEKALMMLDEYSRKHRAKNIEVVVDASRPELRRILSTARYYVHPPFPEHFGIAVAESMAAGLVPIVYRDGGAWTDIVSPLSPTLGYQSPEEVAHIIRRIDDNPAFYEELRSKASASARRFNYDAFKGRLLTLLNTIE